MLDNSMDRQLEEYLSGPSRSSADFREFLQSVKNDYEEFSEKVRSLEARLEDSQDQLARLNEKLMSETKGLQKAHDELSRIFNQVNEGFFTRDILRQEYLDMSVGCERIYGYALEEFFKNSHLWYEVVHPEDREIVDQDGIILNSGETVTSSYRIIHKDKSIRWIEVKAVPVLVDGVLVRVDGVVNDITERKRAEKSVTDSEIKYRSFFENNLDGVLLSKPDGKIIQANPAACEMFRATEEEICSFTHDEMLDFAEPLLAGLLKERNLIGKAKGEVKFFRRDGTSFIAEVASSLFTDGNGEDRASILVRDITERKKAEQQLVDNERRYRILFEQNLAGIYQCTVKGRIVTCNQAFVRMLGYESPHQLRNTNVIGLYNDSTDRDRFLNLLRYETKIYNYEVVLKHRDGYPLHFIENISLFTDAETGEEMYEGIMLDITERIKSEARLKDSEERYRQIVETAQEGIWMVDENDKTTFVNKKLCELMGYSPTQIMGQKILYFMEPSAAREAALKAEGRKKGLNETADLKLLTNSGKAIYVSIATNPVFDDAGVYKGALSMVTDITKRKEDEELLQKSEAILDLKNKELKRKNKELEEFAYIASHDLQEPLRTITSFVQLFKQQYTSKLDEKADKYLHFIVDSSLRMKRLINDLLDYSRIGGRHQMEEVDCNKTVRDVIADLHKAITDSSAQIECEKLPVVYAYPTELKQLFQNLVTNAIKFRKPDIVPHIKISVGSAGNYWDFSVADNGIGIDPAYRERIFIIFQRLHTQSEYPGSGIGLSHCKKIAELHHGRIWVDSTPYEGAEFHFTILKNNEI